jgi:hypothetical protein
MKLRALFAGLAFALSGCVATADSGPPADDAASLDQPIAGWETIGFGVTYQQIGPGADVLIAYGGYTAKDSYVEGWATALANAKLAAAGVGHVYAVRGPNQSAYANQEIQNSRLAKHLAAGRADAATNIVVAAHSSGTYVATELMQMMKAGRAGPTALSKVTLFNLDGGGLDGSLLSAMKNAYFVYACDSATQRCSHNASSMQWLGNKYASFGGKIALDATGSGCSAKASGGLWCLHDTLITTRPHNPVMYDLADDYTDFQDGGPEVVTEYLDRVYAP